MNIVDTLSGASSVVDAATGFGVTGQMVVYNEIVSIVTWPIGQFVIVLWHDVIVYSTVV